MNEVETISKNKTTTDKVDLDNLTPPEIVDQLDRYIIGQEDAKKSVAVAISFRSLERSLSNTEVDRLQEKIVSQLKQNFNAEIRDW